MKLSYSTWGMQTTPIDDAVRHCAALGFDGLELTIIPGWPTDATTMTGIERKRIRRLYDDAGLELCGISGNVDLLADDAVANEARLRSYLDFAAEIQHPGDELIVTTVSGATPGEWDARKGELVEIVGRLAEYAHERGVMVGMEPHVAHALCMPDDAVWLIEQVGSPGATIHFDISHFNVQGIPMVESVVKLTPVSRHTHIKDERGRYPEHEFLIPGEGEMDYPRYLRLMSEAGYDGHIVVEISLMVQRRPDYDALAAATQTYDVLSRAFETAGIDRSPA
ncbi:MAG: sugar phosphate isomerase/epimerase [Thermomicrobiales bacterium]